MINWTKHTEGKFHAKKLKFCLKLDTVDQFEEKQSELKVGKEHDKIRLIWQKIFMFENIFVILKQGCYAVTYCILLWNDFSASFIGFNSIEIIKMWGKW